MRSVSLRLEDIEKVILCLGFVGENEHTRVMFDAKKMYDQYPHAAVSLSVTPPDGESYPAVIERDGDNVIWDITDSDLTAEGQGEYQLGFTDEPHVARTYVGKFRVKRSIIPTGEIQEPLDDFLTRAGAALTAIPETIDEAFDAITAEASTLEPGSSATAEFDPETKTLTIGVPEGKKGDTGERGPAGADGYTPVKGVDYFDGLPGADGFSPTASVTKSGKVSTLTVTDANGTTSVEINDGADGTDIIDDTAGVGDTDKTFSADKLAADHSALLSAISELYPDATSADIGKAIIVKTVANGKPETFELGEAGGGLPDTIPTEETAQELLEYETYNTGLTDTALAVIGKLFTNLPQDETLTDILHSLELECERLDLIYNGWIAERESA